MGLGSKIKAGIAIAVEAVVVKIYIKKGEKGVLSRHFWHNILNVT
jgi:hypothetical protein